ncbi:MAG: FMN-binding negative transcriptional regulator [Caulobacteraceae bacterium]
MDADMFAHKYAPRDWREVVRLIETYPLAWIVSQAGALSATPLPLRAHCDGEGAIVRLDGHFARSNLQVEALRASPDALILFMGPQGYVSPSWMQDRTQAPTWVYASAQFRTRLTLIEDAVGIGESLQDLVGAHEAGRPKAWSLTEMGARYDRLAQGVVAFQAEVLSVQVRFKLGQDEREDVYHDIVRGLGEDGRADLASWLRRPED